MQILSYLKLSQCGYLIFSAHLFFPDVNIESCLIIIDVFENFEISNLDNQSFTTFFISRLFLQSLSAIAEGIGRKLELLVCCLQGKKKKMMKFSNGVFRKCVYALIEG